MKTGHLKELAPLNANWYYIRVAALARKVYLRPNIGVGRLRHLFGGKKNYGSAHEHHAVAAGKIIRDSLKELERIGILQRADQGENNEESKLYARVITSEGAKELNNIAKDVFTKILAAK